MRTLIVYTTKHGCVEKAANILNEKLGGDADLVNLMDELEPDLDPYDAVILGGSIYYGKIQKEMIQFTKNYLAELDQKRIGLFICGAAPNPDVKQKELMEAFPGTLYEKAVYKDVFGDEINFDKLNFMEKMVLRFVKGTLTAKKGSTNLSVDKIDAFAREFLKEIA